MYPVLKLIPKPRAWIILGRMRADLSRAAVWIVLIGGCVAGLLIVAAPAGAQNVGRASGVVRDLDGEPIKGAIVTAENAEAAPRSFTAVTDEKGRFGMLGLRRGVWKFTVQAPGYDTVSAPASIQTLRANPPISSTLARTPSRRARRDRAHRPRYAPGEARRRRIVCETGLYDEAIAAYEGVVGQVPALSSVHLQLGWLYEQKKDTAKAIAAYERAIGTEPESPQAERARTLIARLKSAPGASVPRLNPPEGGSEPARRHRATSLVKIRSTAVAASRQPSSSRSSSPRFSPCAEAGTLPPKDRSS